MFLLRPITCTSKSGKILAQAEKMQPLAALVPVFKAFEIGVVPMRSDHRSSSIVVIVSGKVMCEPWWEV